jgi:hypothetical protein
MAIQIKNRIQLTTPSVDTSIEQLKKPNTGMSDHFFINVFTAM